MYSKDILLNIAAEQGWTTETCLDIMCEFADAIADKVERRSTRAISEDMEEVFEYFLRAKAYQETDEYNNHIKEMFDG